MNAVAVESIDPLALPSSKAIHSKNSPDFIGGGCQVERLATFLMSWMCWGSKSAKA